VSFRFNAFPVIFRIQTRGIGKWVYPQPALTTIIAVEVLSVKNPPEKFDVPELASHYEAYSAGVFSVGFLVLKLKCHKKKVASQ
jgi:hypothetical protein